jgi:hypothetical protein
VAQAGVDRLVVSQRRDARFLLDELQPYTGPQVDMGVQPGLELRGVAERDHHGLVDGRLRRYA